MSHWAPSASEEMRINRGSSAQRCDISLPRDEAICPFSELSHVHTSSELQLHGKPVVRVG